MDNEQQTKTPLLNAINGHIDREVIPFHVPGHKHGRGAKELQKLFGDFVCKTDLNSMEDLDDLCNPVSVIAESQALAADAFGSDRAYYLVNGTTAGVQTMFLTAVRPGETVILPRNCHKSAYSALILSGAIPVYAPVIVNEVLGITMTLSASDLQKTLDKTANAEAVFLVNPSYYGYTGDIEAMVKSAHNSKAVVLTDEAHGCHLGFHASLPKAAMQAGADMSAASLHKTGGSLTQSSILLAQGNRLDSMTILESLDLLRTTSSSYLLMLSLELARRQLALHGTELLDKTIQLARQAREAINEIEGLYAFGSDLLNEDIFAFDETKLNVHVGRLGLTGYEMERILRDRFNIQIELADLSNIMAIVTIGDDENSITKFVTAMQTIASEREVRDVARSTSLPGMPSVIVTPRDAFYSEKKLVPLEKSVGEICGEMVMSYPPGIPVVCPGERISQEVIDYIRVLKEEKCNFQGTYDPYVDNLRVLGL